MSKGSESILLADSEQTAPDRRKIVKRALAIFLPLFGLLLAVTASILFVSGNAEIAAYRSEERHTVAIQAANVDRDILQVSSDLAILAHGRAVENLWNDEGAPASGLLADLAEDYFETSIHRRLYDQVRLLDANGMETIRVNFNNGRPAVVPLEKLQNKKGRYYFDDAFALGPGEVFVSPLDLNIEHGKIEQPLKPMIRFATPVFDKRGEKRGIVLLNYFGLKLIDRLSGQANTSKGSQAMLLNPNGYWLKGPDPENEWGFMYEDRQDRTFANAYPEAWERIQSTETCQFESPLGLFTSQTVYPLVEGQKSSTGSGEAFAPSKAQLHAKIYCWKVVSFLPAKALYATRHNRRVVASLVLALLALVTSLGSWLMADAIAFRKQAEEKREKLIGELREAVENVKTLRGIVPICMHCKKIRDDKGFWQQVEVYVGSHSEADFSHSLCADCMEEFYPDSAEDIEDEEKSDETES